MLFFKFFICLALVAFSKPAMASWFSSNPNSYEGCSEKQEDLCANIEFTTQLNSTDEHVFIVTVTGIEHIQELSASLWMNMECGDQSHPGSPVNIVRLDTNKIEVREAYFFMIGTWEIVVQISSDLLSAPQEIRIPVEIKY